jgi:predicted enzyme related to lactoylglutathione lyase
VRRELTEMVRAEMAAEILPREEIVAEKPGAQKRNFNYVCVCFIVDDVVKSTEYYRNLLGFSFNQYWGEPPCFVMMERDGVEFFLSSQGKTGLVRPNRKADPEITWDAYVNCRDGDALYEEFKSKGAKIMREPEVAFYQMKEFEIEDCNAYWICFGQDTRDE